MNTTDPGAADRYREAKAIALAALERPAAEREDWLTDRCGDDEALRREAAWLIEAAEDDSHDDRPARFQSAAEQVIREVSLKVPLPRDYRLLKRLNEGGMGVVYLAERQDGDLRQPVALKMLPVTAVGDDALLKRFATERNILSRLSHPQIAHLIDGGLTGEGRPFLATEYVDGLHIDDWCEARRASLRTRLALFLKVCSAVDYAHRHMVIHRDIKPSNIIVDAEGEPKLLDFGIARLLDQDAGFDTATRTSPEALTLAYASPEQIEGQGLSAATDVYSLGVVLYQLLTGQRPFDHLASAHLLPAAITAGQIPPPTRLAPSLDKRPLPGDLAAIIMKALRRETDQRYLSVRELAEDIERFLEFRPVVARRGRLLYRARRFVRRHRWGVAASVLVAAMLGGFLIDRENQLKRIAWERDRAEAVTDFMSELFAGAHSLPSRGNEVTVREILDLGASQLGAAEPGSPAMLGSINLALGRAYNALGLGEQALPLLIEAREGLGPTIEPMERARILAEIGAALDSAGRAVEAIAADQLALDAYAAAGRPTTEELLRIRIRKLRNHGNILDQDLVQTVLELENIVAELERTSDGDGELLFEALAALVGAQVVAASPAAAMTTAERAEALAEQLYDPSDPRRLRGRHVHATALMLSDPEAAIEMYQALIRDHERLIGPSQRLANTIGNLGVALSRVGRIDDSMQAFSDAASMIETVAGRDHYLYRLSISNLATLNLRAGEPGRAEALIRDILPDLEARAATLGGVESIYLASALDILASALALSGSLAEADKLYQRALALLAAETALTRPAQHEAIAGRLAEVRRELGEE